jgi:hypothetical protein
MSDKKTFSLGDSLSDVYNRGVPTGLAAELHAELSRHWRFEATSTLSGLRVPFSALMTRQMGTSVPNQGQEWFNHNFLIYGASLLLQPSAVVASGATLLTGLSATTSMPAVTGWTVPPAFVPETGIAPTLDLSTDAVTLRPRRLSTTVIVTRQLLTQGGPELTFAIEDHLSRSFSSIVDVAALTGAGGDQPLGIQNWPGTLLFPFTPATAYADLVAMEAAVELAQVETETTFGYIAAPRTKALLRTTPKMATGDADCWNSITRPRSTIQLTENRIFAGSWSNCLIGIFGSGLELTIDRFSAAGSGRVFIHTSMWGDIILRKSSAFGFTAVIP